MTRTIHEHIAQRVCSQDTILCLPENDSESERVTGSIQSAVGPEDDSNGRAPLNYSNFW